MALSPKQQELSDWIEQTIRFYNKLDSEDQSVFHIVLNKRRKPTLPEMRATYDNA